MNELALFAGHGGGILGGKLLGWRTVCAVEYDDYARRVLMSRQDDGCLDAFPIWDDVRTFDGKPWAGLVDVVSGGFPCQDISAAGSGAGIDGARSGLWGAMARIIREVGPRYVLVENSPMLTSRGLGRVLGDLAAMGYDAAWGVLGAVDAGAPHKRERIWIVAHAAGGKDDRERGAGECRRIGVEWHGQASLGEDRQASDDRADGCSAALAHADSGLRGARRDGRQHASGAWADDESHRSTESAQPVPQPTAGRAGQWWVTEPDVGRVAHGVASRVDRLRGLGNGQVPAVAALAFRTLAARLISEMQNAGDVARPGDGAAPKEKTL